MDAFEKLLKLNLKNKQDREIVHVLLHCCSQVYTSSSSNFIISISRSSVHPSLSIYPPIFILFSPLRIPTWTYPQEKTFNEFYAHLAGRLIGYDQNYKFTIQYSYWDKFKALETLSAKNIANLARLLAHLIATGSLPISMLKVILLNRWMDGWI